MWWPLISTVSIALLLVLHFWWRRRYTSLELENKEKSDTIASLEERHRQSLAYTQDQQEALFNSMAEGVLVLDRAGKIVSANRSLANLLGQTMNIRGQTIMAAFRLHELADLVSRLTTEDTVLGYELTLPGLNPRCLEVNATSVLGQSSERQGAILVFHDLTRLK